MSKRRRDLSLEEKIELIEEYDQLPKMSQREASSKMSISQALLNKLLHSRDEFEAAYAANSNTQ